jgi:hypothetical protein
MKRGDVVYVIRPKRWLKAKLIATYDFPAVRVKMRGEERIVGRNEVADTDAYEDRREQKRRGDATTKHRRVVEHWTSGMTWYQWTASGHYRTGDLMVIRMLKRLELIA